MKWPFFHFATCLTLLGHETVKTEKLIRAAITRPKAQEEGIRATADRIYCSQSRRVSRRNHLELSIETQKCDFVNAGFGETLLQYSMGP
jgi:hypothetical protein